MYCLLLSFLLCTVVGGSNPFYNISFEPQEIGKIAENNQTYVQFTLHCLSSKCTTEVELLFSINDDNIEFTHNSSTVFRAVPPFDGSFDLTAVYVGRGTVMSKITYELDGSSKEAELETFKVAVWRSANENKLAHIFKYVLTAMIILTIFCMGTQLEKEKIVLELKRPFGLSIGFCCQFLIMPLLAFMLGELLMKNKIQLYLGLFVLGCCPGGGASNMWTIMLDGNLNLSVAMTFFSNVGALFMMPLWLYTLGEMYILKGQENVHIPFVEVLKALAMIFFPSAAGMLVRHFLPNFQKVIAKYLKPVVLVIVVVTKGFGCYANSHIFRLFDWRVVIGGGILLPWGGFTIAGIIAFLLKQDWKNVRTIAIETGIQAGAIATVVVVQSLEHPDSDIAVVVPFCAILVTSAPLLVISMIWACYQKIQGNKNKKEEVEYEMAEVDYQNN